MYVSSSCTRNYQVYACRNVGGYLVTNNSATEGTYIASYSGDSISIGYNDLASAGTFVRIWSIYLRIIS